MNKSNFTVIRGGLLDSVQTSRREFVSAYVTNTRLMGVLGMYIHFKLPDNEVMNEIHQFFYFDIEEYGFETYQSVKDSDMNHVREIENSLIGGLGGEEEPITLRQAQYLLQKYVRFNNKMGIPMPEGLEEYHFLLEESIVLSPEEEADLNLRQCVEIDSEYETINYFLMRCTGKDFEGAYYLADKNLYIDLFPEFKAGTFCKNTVNKGSDPDTFLSESLVELEDGYYLVATNVTLDNLKVVRYERISAFRISPSEASLMLARPEFVTVYNLPEESLPFTKASTKLTRRAMVNDHDNGALYMMFHQNNKHVAKKEYSLNEDILGIYYVTHSKQLIATAYSLPEIRILEYNLLTAEHFENLRALSKYEFRDPVFYEFVQSGFDDFEEFVDLIKVEE